MTGVGGVRWTPLELQGVRPDVLDAARWRVYAERMWPGSDVEAQLTAPDKPSEAYLRAERRKGRTALHAIRKQLLPPDEVSDGG